MPDQKQFDFMREPVPKKHKLFLALFPDRPAAMRIHSFGLEVCEAHGIRKQLLQERLHVTLVQIADRKRLRGREEWLAEQAAFAVRLPSFEMTFTCMGSFRGNPKKNSPLKHPLVLLADPGTVNDLHRVLSGALRRHGFQIDGDFRPHLTIAYHGKMLPWQSIEPIRFRVCEFVLVDSFYGMTHYEIKGRWPLGPLLLPPPEREAA